MALRDKGLVYQIKKDSQEEEKFTVGSGEECMNTRYGIRIKYNSR